MASDTSYRKGKLKIVALVLLLVGSFFTSINFISPHTSEMKKIIQVPYQTFSNSTFLGSKPYFTLGHSAGYDNFDVIYVNASQQLAVTWDSDLWLGGFIFSQQQFSKFQSAFSNTSSVVPTSDVVQWAKMNGIEYEAAGWESKYGDVYLNVTQSGNYVALITNAMYDGGATANIYEFKEQVFSYQTQYSLEAVGVKQTDNLYLYLGIVFLVVGAISLIIHRRHRKTTVMKL